VDSLLIVGSQDTKLSNLLKKMGYALLQADGTNSIGEVIEKNIIDLIIIDSQMGGEWSELCTYFRSTDSTSSVPIVCLASDAAKIKELKEKGLEKLEFIESPYTPGSVVSKIALNLRLRKIDGKDNSNARLGEINAALRDLNDRFAQQMREAKQIQDTLLPAKLPQDPRFEIALAFAPLEDVGGDWYYVAKEESGKLSVQIADVTGHGLSAAFICAMTKLARSAAKKEAPEELLGEMNRLMEPVLPSGRFITVGSYLYDPASGTLRLARAGHPPALVLKRKENKVVQSMTDGFAVGFLDDSQYGFEQHILEVNDMVLVFTDGLSEASNMRNEMYGFDRAAKVMLESQPAASSAEVLQKIFDDFESFRDGRLLKDDVTAIVLKRVV